MCGNTFIRRQPCLGSFSRLPTDARLQRFGVPRASMYVLCKRVGEGQNHILFTLAANIWKFIVRQFGVGRIPSTNMCFELVLHSGRSVEDVVLQNSETKQSTRQEVSCCPKAEGQDIWNSCIEVFWNQEWPYHVAKAIRLWLKTQNFMPFCYSQNCLWRWLH